MPPDPLAVLCDRPARPRDDVPTLSLRADRSAPSTARRFVDAILAGLIDDEHLDDVQLVTDELVTNALHAAERYSEMLQFAYGYLDKPLAIGVLAAERWTRIDVRDPDPLMREPQQAGVWDESGRGLGIVDALSAARWHTPASHYKIVHALVMAPGVEPTAEDLRAAGR